MVIRSLQNVFYFRLEYLILLILRTVTKVSKNYHFNYYLFAIDLSVSCVFNSEILISFFFALV